MHAAPVQIVTGDSVLSMTTVCSSHDNDVFYPRQRCVLPKTTMSSWLDSAVVLA